MLVPLSRYRTVTGVSLGGTMLAVAVLCILASALASLGVTHFRLTSRVNNGRLAANAARSVASLAIAKVLQQPDFGRDRRAGDLVRYQLGEASGLVSFHQGTARDQGLKLSTNNLEGTSDAPGDGGSFVPAGTVELCCLGRSAGSVRRLDVVLRIPPFPWAIASAGRIETQNGVLVAALPEGVWPPPTDPELLLPADLVANSALNGSIVLGDRSLVLGDVETAGRVVLRENQVEVRGEIRDGASPVELPTLRASDYDPELTGVSHYSIEDGDVAEIVGTARVSHDVTFPEQLTLTNGTLFVDGDLTLRRGVEGRGALVATGDITVVEGAALDGLTELAVVSGGRVILSGAGKRRSAIRGLFYAQQGLEARELTLTGSLLTGSASTGVALDQVNVYYEPQGPRPGGTGSFPDGEFYVGQYPTVDNIHPDPMYLGFQPGSIPPLPGNSPLFHLSLSSTEGGYPITITISSPLSGGTFGPGTLNDRQELVSFLRQAEAAMRASLGSIVPSEAYFNIFQDLGLSLLEFDAAQGVQPPAVVLMGDISAFLPLEDRVKVVSWVEY